ncbi:MAG TPA: hypothetical protein VF522_19165 [Ramlibacter sp.]|uniref:hypothetical protein n=1 Tax=Ramlibacter sp. TaxID=1917967 RepID=UPI002ED155D1
MTTKHAGADCPKCGDPYPAEYAQQGQSPRWSCTCGAGGELSGHFTARRALHAPPPPSTVKKHWRTP